MLVLFALSIASAPAQDSPARRLDASVGFTATAIIRRGIAVGSDMAPPPGAHAKRAAMVEDRTGQPYPAIVYDFE